MRIIDLAITIAQRHAAFAVDTDTALEQLKVACQQFPADPHRVILDLALETVRYKTALAAAKRESRVGG